MAALSLRLGERTFDLSTTTLVMGILNRTPDSFFDRGATFALEALIDRADRLVADGADVLDIGGVKAGPGPEVSEEEELDRVVPAVEGVCSRFDIAVSVDTWRSSVVRAAYQAGATIGNDISGFSDPDYLKVSHDAGATVVATHIRLAPRVRDPAPRYDDVVGDVSGFLAQRVERAVAEGIDRRRIVVDAGLDLGKTPEQSLALLRATPKLAELGCAVLLSASNKPFLGALLGLEVDRREDASLGAVAMGVALGSRIVRVHDVAGARKACDTIRAVLEAT
jgi:dihydropteroate synthase